MSLRCPKGRARTRRAIILTARSGVATWFFADGEEGYTTPGEASSAAAKPFASPRTSGAPTRDEPLALDAVRVHRPLLPDALQEGDVTVYTTLDMNAQKAADRPCCARPQS